MLEVREVDVFGLNIFDHPDKLLAVILDILGQVLVVLSNDRDPPDATNRVKLISR